MAELTQPVKVYGPSAPCHIEAMPKTLLVRMDKIGDLVLSLNADQHPGLRESQCQWLIAKGLDWVAQAHVPSKNFKSFSKKFSWKVFWDLHQFLRAGKFDQIVIFQAPWFVAAAAWLAGIGKRCGRLSQWHSFLFLNQGVRQKRSLAEKHESHYNFDLVTLLTGVPWDLESFPYPKMRSPVSAPKILPKDYIVVHPGMFGSALNWPKKNYIQLVEVLLSSQSVVLTGTPSDAAWTQPIVDRFGSHTNFTDLTNRLSPEQLLGTLEQSKLVIAPSTGVLHLAAALGRFVVSFYSPRTSEKAIRWGPLTEYRQVYQMQHEHMNDVSPATVQKDLNERLSAQRSPSSTH